MSPSLFLQYNIICCRSNKNANVHFIYYNLDIKFQSYDTDMYTYAARMSSRRLPRAVLVAVSHSCRPSSRPGGGQSQLPSAQPSRQRWSTLRQSNSGLPVLSFTSLCMRHSHCERLCLDCVSGAFSVILSTHDSDMLTASY